MEFALLVQTLSLVDEGETIKKMLRFEGFQKNALPSVSK